MFSKSSSLYRFGLTTVFTVVGVVVTLFLTSRVVLHILDKARAENILTQAPRFEPDITAFLLMALVNDPGMLWPGLAVLVLGVLISLVGAWTIYQNGVLSEAEVQNMKLDENLRQTQKKWRQADLANKDLHQQISVMHERVSDCFIFVSRNGEVLHANTKASQFFERNLNLQQDLKGTQLSLLIPGYQETDFGKALEVTQEKNRPGKIEAELSRHVWVQARLYPTARGVFVYFEDVSRQKSAKVKVETSVSLLRQILDSALQPSAITDKNWNYVAANKQWLSQFKLNNDKILGHYFG